MMNNYMDLKAFRKDVEKALEGVAKKYGVDISAGNIRYGTNDLSIKLDVIRNDIDVELLEFKSKSKYFPQINEDDYGKVIKMKNKEYKLCGFKCGNKYSVLAKRVSDGALYGFTYDDVVRALGRQAL